ncbi:MAG: hypothetical protein ACSLFQ_02075 [Thermoanaerobaculia bacterium]
MKRLFPLIFLFALCACDVTDRARDFIAPPKDPPQTIDLICDFGGGSSGCTSDSLTSILREITPGLPAGSVVRLHGMTDDVAEATQLASFTITAPKKRTVRAVAGHKSRQTEAIVTQFLAAAAPVFKNEDRRQSPVAETIARVVMAGNATAGAREITVLSDTRQVSKRSPALGSLEFECGPILPGDEFAKRLCALFPERGANGITIHFRFAKFEPVANNRCTATVERYAALKNAWTVGLEQLGARVTWSMN